MATPVAYGLCQCGCGEKTRLAPCTKSRCGWVKGQPLKYILGHNHALKVRHVEEDCGYKTPCWVYQGTKVSKGYGWVRVGGDNRYAHVLEWEKVNGPVPDGLELDHLCRNPPCCNPAHLEAVTHAENMRRSPRCILDAEKVAEIRRLLATGMIQRVIADHVGVTRGVVRDVKTGKSWVGVG